MNQYPITLEVFIGTLQHSVEIAHKYHLEARDGKLVTHLALDDYYNSIPEVIDSIYEETAAHIDLGELKSVFVKSDFATPTDYLQSLRNFIISNKNDLYDTVISSNIHSHLDTFVSLIDTAIYQIKNLSEGLESKTSEDAAIAKAQKEYISDDLSYNGKPIRSWFEKMSGVLSSRIEQNLKRDYRCVSRQISAVFFSNVAKDFIVVFESYRHNHYAMCRTKMIEIYQADGVDDIKFFKCLKNSDLIDFVKKLDSTMVPLYVNCREELIEEKQEQEIVEAKSNKSDIDVFISIWDRMSILDREKFFDSMRKEDRERWDRCKSNSKPNLQSLLPNNFEAMPEVIQDTMVAYWKFVN